MRNKRSSVEEVPFCVEEIRNVMASTSLPYVVRCMYRNVLVVVVVVAEAKEKNDEAKRKNRIESNHRMNESE